MMSFDWTDGSFAMPNWNELVIYRNARRNPERHARRFARELQFGHRAAWIIFAILGTNAVKVMPVNEFPGDFSWGYNPSHPFTVESAYGGPREFKRFVDEAHARGIAVMLDLVHNHWGPSDMDLWRFDGYATGNWGGIYFYQDARSETPWGETRPDFGRNEVRQYIRDNVMMWLEDFHVDGLRMDSTSNIHYARLG